MTLPLGFFHLPTLTTWNCNGRSRSYLESHLASKSLPILLATLSRLSMQLFILHQILLRGKVNTNLISTGHRSIAQSSVQITRRFVRCVLQIPVIAVESGSVLLLRPVQFTGACY